MKWQMNRYKRIALLLFVVPFIGCAQSTYSDSNMDFGSIQSVAVMPFQNLTRDIDAAERVRDTFMGMLLATESIYVLPAGETARGIERAAPNPAYAPSSDKIKTLGSVLSVDTVITGVLREYGSVRSGANSANMISLSLQMIEVDGGQVVWSASATAGGVTVMDRLIGGGGEPMSAVTEKAINELLNDLFQ